MRVERVIITPVSYRMLSPLATRRVVLKNRQGFRVRLHTQNLVEGFGEALPLETSGTESYTESEIAIQTLGSALTGYSGSLDDLLDRVDQAAPESPAARCGFDGAIHDLEGRLRGLSVARLLGASPPLTLPANAVIGSQESEETLRVARDTVARGFRTLKLKVGERSDQEDLARIQAVRHTLDSMKPDLHLRIDANGAWHAPEALQILKQIAPLRIELVEQPVPAQDLEGLARVHSESPIPVAADESLAHPAGRQAALDGKICSFVVLKPMVLGGLRACARFAAAAHKRNLRCYVTTTFEGGVGTALAAHLAAAIAEPELACGIASDEVLDADFPPELIPHEGRLRILDKPGLGWRPEP